MKSLLLLFNMLLLGGCATTSTLDGQQRVSSAASSVASPGSAKVSTAAVAKPASMVDRAPKSYDRPCAVLPTTPEQSHECDRQSILAMAGEFRVRFAFDETAALQPGYAPHAPQRSGGTEWVNVIGDSGEKISLQHILVVGPDHTVVKHWRQDWHYQPSSILRFQGNGRFVHEPVSADMARGRWSQIVYEVDEAPRYAGLGRWRHDNGIDSWQSELTLRPLPRRDYSKRSDYQALEVINRHTLTPAGWVHEQFNTKLQIDKDGARTALAREQGLNQYIRISDYDFSAGREYWKSTSDYWAQVRAEWQRGIDASPAFTIGPEPNGEPRIEELFDQAERVGKGETISRSEIDAILRKHGLPL